MARPLRIEFAGALYHITSRSDRREAIYEDDGDREAFVKRMQARATVEGDALTIPRAQRRPTPPSLAEVAACHDGRNAAIVAAYTAGAYSDQQIAEHFGVHLATVGRIVRGAMLRCEN